MDEGLRRLTDVVGETGASYRSVDYWVRLGLIHTLPGAHPAIPGRIAPLPEHVGEFTTPGSGYTRLITPVEADILRLLARMSLAGLPPQVAAPIARFMVTTGIPNGDLGHGLAIIDTTMDC